MIANMINAVGQKSVAPEVARSLTEAHPDDWRSWWLAWRAAQNASASREAREKTCSLLEANPAAVPIEACARDATGAFAEDPRRAVFVAAAPQIFACLKKSKQAELGATFSFDIDIADSGSVIAARASMGSPEINGFPAHHIGTFDISSSRSGH